MCATLLVVLITTMHHNFHDKELDWWGIWTVWSLHSFCTVTDLHFP